jgi:tRNA pseudouridine38-40 synthase
VRLKLTVEYDGTGFRGWARQPAERTVEGELRSALGAAYAAVDGLTVAGRTDRGVHALANVVSVDVDGGPPTERAAEALNGVLPADLAVVAVQEAGPSFSARFDAVARSYRYRLWRRRERSPFEERRSLWYPRPLDLEALHAAAELVPGRRDFRAFTPAETEHESFIRTVASARWVELDEGVLAFEITADSFLRHMVRTLVGTMLDGLDLAPLLEGCDRRAAGRTAPPHGLYLTSVRYK